MPTTISFNFFGDQQIQRTLADREEWAEDARPVWNVLADRFAKLERRQFQSQGAYGSGGWAPLSPAYAKFKAARYPGKTILRRSDELFNSLTKRPFGIEIITPHLAVFGSDVEHGEFHQKGTSRMPRRRPVELPESERREWVNRIQRYVVTGRTS